MTEPQKMAQGGSFRMRPRNRSAVNFATGAMVQISNILLDDVLSDLTHEFQTFGIQMHNHAFRNVGEVSKQGSLEA